MKTPDNDVILEALDQNVVESVASVPKSRVGFRTAATKDQNAVGEIVDDVILTVLVVGGEINRRFLLSGSKSEFQPYLICLTQKKKSLCLL